MRVLGFERHWDKLDNPNTFTTFRFTKKDADKGHDWKVGETVQIFIQPRASYESGKRKRLGIATIIKKEPRIIGDVTDDEAIADGFPGGRAEMFRWLQKKYHLNLFMWHTALKYTMNKLTLRRRLTDDLSQ